MGPVADGVSDMTGRMMTQPPQMSFEINYKVFRSRYIYHGKFK